MRGMIQAMLVIVCFAIVGGMVTGAVGALIRGNRGATVGFIVGAILAPLGLILFWVAVIRSGVFGSLG